jgi:hypothetical protein
MKDNYLKEMHSPSVRVFVVRERMNLYDRQRTLAVDYENVYKPYSNYLVPIWLLVTHCGRMPDFVFFSFSDNNRHAMLPEPVS